MESQFLEQALNWGLGGLFLWYLVFMSFRNEKKLAEKEKNYETRLDLLRTENVSSQETIRSRYEDVVKNYNDQIAAFAQGRAEQIATYAEERAESRASINEALNDIRQQIQTCTQEIADNGKSIIRLQEQLKSVFRSSRSKT